MTAPSDKAPSDPASKTSDALHAGSASSANEPDRHTPSYAPHLSPDSAPKDHAAGSDQPTAPAPGAEPTRKAISALMMGVLGGIGTVALLALLALIFNPLPDIVERLSAVESTVAAAATRRAVETNDKRLAALESRVDTLRIDLDTLARNPITGPVDLNGLKAHLAQIDQILASLQNDTAKSKIASASPLAQDAARLILSVMIADLIEQGQPIRAESEAIEPLITDPSLLAALKPWSDGNPAPVMLLNRFTQAYPASLKALPAPADEDVQAMLLRQLKQWVNWRRRDQSESTDPTDQLQRLHQALQTGQAAEARTLLRALPDPMRKPLQPLDKALTDRLDALKAAEMLLQSARSQLALSAQSKGTAP